MNPGIGECSQIKVRLNYDENPNRAQVMTQTATTVSITGSLQWFPMAKPSRGGVDTAGHQAVQILPIFFRSADMPHKLFQRTCSPSVFFGLAAITFPGQ